MIDTPVLTFDEPEHAYTLNGKRVRSVTQILRKVGLINFDHVPPYVMDPALARGRAVHKALEYWHQQDLDVAAFSDAYPDWRGYVFSWIRLMESGRFETFAVEQRVANCAPMFAGCYDWLGTVDGDATLIDFATGNPYDACKSLQTAAYCIALRAWSHTPGQERVRAFLDQHPYVRRFSARLSRDGSVPQLTEYRDPRDLTTFLRIAEALALVDAERPRSVPWNWVEDSVSVVNA